jgi:hypothetical protein
MQRRTFFKLGVASAVVLAVAGGAAAWVEGGLQAGRLTASGRDVFRAAGRALLDGSLPSEAPARQAALDALLLRIDELTRALPPHAQHELSQLLALLTSVPGRYAMTGLKPPWPAASGADIQKAFEGMRVSGLALRQQAYAALHDITTAAYFSEPSTWPVLGYPGPLKI